MISIKMKGTGEVLRKIRQLAETTPRGRLILYVNPRVKYAKYIEYGVFKPRDGFDEVGSYLRRTLWENEAFIHSYLDAIKLEKLPAKQYLSELGTTLQSYARAIVRYKTGNLRRNIFFQVKDASGGIIEDAGGAG
jgi:hypothetical protein